MKTVRRDASSVVTKLTTRSLVALASSCGVGAGEESPREISPRILSEEPRRNCG